MGGYIQLSENIVVVKEKKDQQSYDFDQYIQYFNGHACMYILLPMRPYGWNSLYNSNE